MNRTKKALPKQQLKAMRKEVRKAVPYPEPAKKIAPISLQKLLKNKKIKKATSKTSKRTTPGMVNDESVPQSVHPEGRRWIKTVVKQNILKGKLLSKRLAKR